MRTLLIINLLFLSIFCYSQNEVRIMDLKYFPQTLQSDSLSDSLSIMISFKLNRPDEVSNVKMGFGTAKELDDVASFTGTIFNNNGRFFTLLNSYSKEIVQYNVQYLIKMSKQQVLLIKNMFVFAQLKNGLNTERIYFQNRIE